MDALLPQGGLLLVLEMLALLYEVSLPEKGSIINFPTIFCLEQPILENEDRFSR